MKNRESFIRHADEMHRLAHLPNTHDTRLAIANELRYFAKCYVEICELAKEIKREKQDQN